MIVSGSTGAVITGDKEIDRKLQRLSSSGQRRIGRAMVGAMLTEINRGIRNAIPPKQKSVKKTLGRRHKKNKKKNEYEAKVGLGVGKRSKSKKQRDPKKPGVGISKANVHWLILGTDDRYTGQRKYRVKSGFRIKSTGGPRRYTGKMPKAPDWVKQGYAASRHQAIQKAHAIGRKKLAEEARK